MKRSQSNAPTLIYMSGSNDRHGILQKKRPAKDRVFNVIPVETNKKLVSVLKEIRVVQVPPSLKYGDHMNLTAKKIELPVNKGDDQEDSNLPEAINDVPDGCSERANPQTLPVESQGLPPFILPDGDCSPPAQSTGVPESGPAKTFQTSGCGSFSPQHFPLRSLQIGVLKIDWRNTSHKFTKAKSKLLFGRRKLMYEFDMPLTVTSDDIQPSKAFLQVTIEVKFSAITNMSPADSMVALEVDSRPNLICQLKTPEMQLPEIVAQYVAFQKEFAHHLDSSPYHWLTLADTTGENFCSFLCQFEGRFQKLLSKNMLVHADKPLRNTKEVMVEKSSGSEQTHQRTGESSLPGQHRCGCLSGCIFTRCGCMKRLLPCSQTCRCVQIKNCRNPLNYLESCGVNDFLSDRCLMDNLHSSQMTENCFQRLEYLKCCKVSVPRVKLLPGVVKCPGKPDCEKRYRFSWCTDMLCDGGFNQRVHCKICVCCSGRRELHCEVCNTCHHVNKQCRMSNGKNVPRENPAENSGEKFEDYDVGDMLETSEPTVKGGVLLTPDVREVVGDVEAIGFTGRLESQTEEVVPSDGSVSEEATVNDDVEVIGFTGGLESQTEEVVPSDGAVSEAAMVEDDVAVIGFTGGLEFQTEEVVPGGGTMSNGVMVEDDIEVVGFTGGLESLTEEVVPSDGAASAEVMIENCDFQDDVDLTVGNVETVSQSKCLSAAGLDENAAILTVKNEQEIETANDANDVAASKDVVMEGRSDIQDDNVLTVEGNETVSHTEYISATAQDEYAAILSVENEIEIETADDAITVAFEDPVDLSDCELCVDDSVSSVCTQPSDEETSTEANFVPVSRHLDELALLTSSSESCSPSQFCGFATEINTTRSRKRRRGRQTKDVYILQNKPFGQLHKTSSKVKKKLHGRNVKNGKTKSTRTSVLRSPNKLEPFKPSIQFVSDINIAWDDHAFAACEMDLEGYSSDSRENTVDVALNSAGGPRCSVSSPDSVSSLSAEDLGTDQSWIDSCFDSVSGDRSEHDTLTDDIDCADFLTCADENFGALEESDTLFYDLLTPNLFPSSYLDVCVSSNSHNAEMNLIGQETFPLHCQDSFEDENRCFTL